LTGSVQNGDQSQQPKGFWVIWSTVALDQIVFAMVLPILPILATDFGASPLTVTALVAVFALAQFLVSPIAGALSDRFGRKPIIIVSLVGSAIGSLILGLAGTLPLLFLGRAVDGLSGTAIVSAQAAISDVVEPRHRARYLGLLGTAFAAGFILGPGLTALTSRVDPKLPFFIASGLGLLNAAAALFRLPETHPRQDSATLGEDASPLSAFRNAGAIGSAAWFYIGILVAALFAFAAIEGGTFTLLAQERAHLDATGIAMVFVMVGILLAVVQGFAVGPMNSRLGPRLTVAAALGLSAIGLFALSAADSRLTLMLAIALPALAQGALRPTLTASVTNASPPQMRGRAIGMQTSAQGLVRIVGPLFAGVLYTVVSPGAPFVASAVITAATLVMVVVTKPRWAAATATAAA
jgi:multidrug resistance protein